MAVPGPPAPKAAPVVSTQPLPSAVRWSVEVAARPAAPPVIEGPHVFVVLQSGVVAAHRVDDGTEAWRVELKSERPVAADSSRVFVASGEAIHALNGETAEVLWRTPIGTITSPLVAHEGWVIAITEAAVTALRAADGTKVWSRTTGPQRERATIEGDHLYLPLDDGRLLALDLPTGADRWSRHFTGPLSEVLAFPDRVYLASGDNYFYCLEAANGAWTFSGGWRARIGAALRGRPAATDARVFTASMDNTLRAFDRRDGALRWQQSLPFRPSATGPVVIGSALVAPGPAAELRAYSVDTGAPIGQIALSAEPSVPPAFATVGSQTIMAAVTGSLNEKVMLVLTEAPLPQIQILPLTAIPGVIVTVEPPVPPQP